MKYRIRDFVWLFLAVGLILGWYVDRSALSVDRDALSKKLASLAVIGVDFEVVVDESPEAERTYFGTEKEEVAKIKAALMEFRAQIAPDQNPVEFQTFDLFDESGSRSPNHQSEEFPGFDGDTSLP